MSQGSLVVAATTLAVLGVTVPRPSSSGVRGLPDPRGEPAVRLSDRPAQHSDSSVWTFHPPVATPDSPAVAPALNVAVRPSSVFERFDLPAPPGEGPVELLRAAR